MPGLVRTTGSQVGGSTGQPITKLSFACASTVPGSDSAAAPAAAEPRRLRLVILLESDMVYPPSRSPCMWPARRRFDPGRRPPLLRSKSVPIAGPLERIGGAVDRAFIPMLGNQHHADG